MDLVVFLAYFKRILPQYISEYFYLVMKLLNFKEDVFLKVYLF